MLSNIVQPSSYEAPLNDDGYVEVTNNGAFSATLYVEYLFNGSSYPINSDLFAVGTSKKIIIPEGATHIFVLVRIANGLSQFTPVYNYNFDTSRILKLKLTGSIFNQSCDDVTNDPQYPSTTPPQYYISVQNSGGFIARFKVNYTFSNKNYTIESQNFTLGMHRMIILPPNCSNIFMLVEFYDGLKWVTLYNNNFNDPKVLKMELYGTVFGPQYKILPDTPSVGDSPAPKMLLVQYPSKSIVYSGEVVLIVTNISNIGTATASKVSLLPTLPSNALFIAGSLTVNNTPTDDIEFPTSGIQLGNIGVNETSIVTYQFSFKANPSTDTLKNPIINYISGNSNDSSSQIISYTGTATPLTVKVNNPCSCNCNCSSCNCNCNSCCNCNHNCSDADYSTCSNMCSSMDAPDSYSTSSTICNSVDTPDSYSTSSTICNSVNTPDSYSTSSTICNSVDTPDSYSTSSTICNSVDTPDSYSTSSTMYNTTNNSDYYSTSPNMYNSMNNSNCYSTSPNIYNSMNNSNCYSTSPNMYNSMNNSNCYSTSPNIYNSMNNSNCYSTSPNMYNSMNNSNYTSTSANMCGSMNNTNSNSLNNTMYYSNSEYMY